MGLPLRAPRSAWLAVSSLALYLVASMARDLSLYDSGELALAAVQLGLGHPPGQPLHTLIGFVFAHLPFVSPLVGVGLVSALPSALTLIPATSLGQRLLGERASVAALSGMPWAIAVCALHPCVWEPATRVEVYALATLGAVWTLAAAAELPVLADAHVTKRIFQLGVALGLTASVNPVIALASAFAILPALIARMRWQPLLLRQGFAALAGGLVGLLPYAYVPWVAARTDVMVWGAPHDLQSYLHYFLLRDYVHNQAITASQWWSHVGDWLGWAGQVGLWPLLVFGLIGHVALGAGSSKLSALIATALLVANIAANVVWHVDVPDYNGYLATAFWSLSAGAAAVGLRVLVAARQSTHVFRDRAFKLAAAAGLAVCLESAVATSPSPFARTRSRDRLARTMAERVLEQAPQNAIVISETDAVTGALFYLQGAERARPDVVVLAYGLANSSWHWDQLAKTHRDLKSFELRGEGARAGRVERFVAANPTRPVAIERWSTARELGLSTCASGLFLSARSSDRQCTVDGRQEERIARTLANELATLGDGSPSVSGSIAQTTYELGEALWRLGDPASAHAMLLAGVPRSSWPSRTLSTGFERAPTPPPQAAAFSYEKPAALGDPGRNLFLAGAIVNSTGERELAREYLRAAAATGLPEAERMLGSPTLQRAARYEPNSAN